MLLIQENQSVTVVPKPLRITGTVDKIEQAKRYIEQLLAADDGSHVNQFRSNVSGPRSIGEVIVPRSSVGIIIGKGGETIKRLASETGAKIQFKPDGQCLYFYLNKS
jgi:far upstream element-binding protein